MAPSARRVARQPFSSRSFVASALIDSGPPVGHPPNAASSNSTASRCARRSDQTRKTTPCEVKRRTLQLQQLEPVGRVHVEHARVA